MTVLRDVTVELINGVAVITLNRPLEGNTITPAMHKTLYATWHEVMSNNEIRVAIITGAGERHFCFCR